MTDPTTSLIERVNAERDQLRVEVDRLSKALVAAYTDVEVLSASRDRLRVLVREACDLGIKDVPYKPTAISRLIAIRTEVDGGAA